MEETDTFREELRTWRSVSTLLGGQDGPSSDASVVQSSSAIDPGSSAEREGAVPTLVIEVLLDLSDMSPNQVLVLNNPEGKRVRVDLHRRNSRTSTVLEDGDSRPNTCTIVLERWALSLKPSIPAILPELPTVYKHCIIVRHERWVNARADSPSCSYFELCIHLSGHCPALSSIASRSVGLGGVNSKLVVD